MAADSHVRVTDAQRPPRWRFLLGAVALALAAVAALVGWQALRGARARAELRQVIAELDRDEPDWRIEAIEAARAAVPDAENSAPIILQARKAMPRLKNVDFERLRAMLANLTSNVRLTDEQYDTFTAYLKTMGPAIPFVERLADMPRGRGPMEYAADGVSTDLVLVNDAGRIYLWPTYLLVLTRAHDGDFAAALRMCVANLHMAAAIGDEPFLVYAGCRWRHVCTALEGLERLLGQGDLSDADLAAFQAKLAVEVAYDPWAVGLHAMRATHHQALDAVARGILSRSAYRTQAQDAPGGTGWHDRVRDWTADRLPAPVEAYEADIWLLRRTTRLIHETATASWPKRAAAMQVFADDMAAAPELARLSPNYWPKMVVWLQGDVARLRCGMTFTAVERYRLRHGQWPESLAALVPEFLPAVPTDPFDDQPLRYRRTADGVVIYSVGPDRQDNGGTLSPAGVVVAAPGSDIGFTLWDVSRRRRPPTEIPR